MGLRSWVKRLERGASEGLQSFELQGGSTYYYDRLETYKELVLHAYDLQLGMGDNWPEPPEVYRKICEAKDQAAVLKRFKPEYPQRALVDRLVNIYCRTVQVRVAWVGSVLPAASVAHTSKVWEPLIKPVYLLGHTQALKAAASSLHSEIAFGSEEKVNVASFCFAVL
jgi:hypothetical protein